MKLQKESKNEFEEDHFVFSSSRHSASSWISVYRACKVVVALTLTWAPCYDLRSTGVPTLTFSFDHHKSIIFWQKRKRKKQWTDDTWNLSEIWRCTTVMFYSLTTLLCALKISLVLKFYLFSEFYRIGISIIKRFASGQSEMPHLSAVAFPQVESFSFLSWPLTRIQCP